MYMNMAKKLVLAAGLTLLGGAAAFGEYARGYFNNWADDCPLTRPEGCKIRHRPGRRFGHTDRDRQHWQT